MFSEFFSKLMMKEEVRVNINGITISREVLAISHLLYADDIKIACLANSMNASSVL